MLVFPVPVTKTARDVPRVCDIFNDGADSTYLAMEHVDASSSRAWIDEPEPLRRGARDPNRRGRR